MNFGSFIVIIFVLSSMMTAISLFFYYH